MSNPVTSKYAEFTSRPNYVPYANNQRITLDDVLMKALALFGILVPTAIATAFLVPQALLGTVWLGTFAIGIVLGIVIAVKKTVSVPLIIAYTLVQGVFTGAASAFYNHMFEGAVTTAVVATTVTALVVIFGVKSGFLRTSGTARKIFGYLLLGYFSFTLIAVGAALLGMPILTLGSPLLLIVAVFGVGMATFSFVTDVEDVQVAVANGAPKGEDWRLAFGVVVSLVWLYLEILRLIAAIRSIAD